LNEGEDERLAEADCADGVERPYEAGRMRDELRLAVELAVLKRFVAAGRLDAMERAGEEE
jgi:hypothetical protein